VLDTFGTYGESFTSFRYSCIGFLNGDSIQDLTTGINIYSSATNASPVGSYVISIDSTTAANYDVMVQNGTLVITPAKLYLKAKDTSSVYGGSIATLATIATGFVNGETLADLQVAPVLQCQATSASQTGTYPITIGGALSSNYLIVMTDGVYTITKASLHIYAVDTSSIYGSAIAALQLSSAGLQNGEQLQNLDSVCKVTCNVTSASPVGLYEITLSGGADSNYEITLHNGLYQVTKSQLLVAATNDASEYGSEPILSPPTYIGFVNGDTESDLIVPSFTSTVANSSSDVGVYPINLSLAVSNNYELSYQLASLFLTKAPLLVTARDTAIVYGSNIVTNGVHVAGLKNDDNEAELFGTQIQCSTVATELSGPGSFTIVVPDLTADNYSIERKDGTLSILMSPKYVVDTAIDKYSMVISPNPASDQITLTASKYLIPGTLTVYSVAGQIMEQLEMTSYEKVIDIKHLPNGEYFAMIAVSTAVRSNIVRFLVAQ
jgi:hypothetical protein